MNFIELHSHDETRSSDRIFAKLVNVDHIALVYGNPCKVHIASILGPPVIQVVTETYEQVKELMFACDGRAIVYWDENGGNVQRHGRPQ